MKFILTFCICALAFSKSIESKNEELRHTNQALLKTLRELAVGKEEALGELHIPEPTIPDGEGTWYGYMHTGDGPVYCGAKNCQAWSDCDEANRMLLQDKDVSDLSGCPCGWETSDAYGCKSKNFWGTWQYLRVCRRGSRCPDDDYFPIFQETSVGKRFHHRKAEEARVGEDWGPSRSQAACEKDADCYPYHLCMDRLCVKVEYNKEFGAAHIYNQEFESKVGKEKDN